MNITELKDEEIIHLYMVERCEHKCALCCNKQYDMEKVQVVTVEELKTAKVVFLTGGEPFLVDNVCGFAANIKEQYKNIELVMVYTCGDSLLKYLEKHGTLDGIDGVTICPKNRYDVECVRKVFSEYRHEILKLASNFIYIFPNVRQRRQSISVPESDVLYGWVNGLYADGYENLQVREREWQSEFSPNGGIFRRLPILCK